MRVGLLLAFSFALGCQKEKAAAQEPGLVPSASAASAPSSAAKAPVAAASAVPQPPKVAGIDAVASRNGVKHELRNALVWAYEGGRILHVELSTHARTCEDLKRDDTRLVGGEQVFEVVLSPPLAASADWNVATIFQTDGTGTLSPAIASYGGAKVAAADPASTVPVTFSSPMTGDVVIVGSVQAKGCGRRPYAAPEPAKLEQKGLTLEIDGQKVPVFGALFDVAHERVTVTNGGAACGHDAIEPEIELRLEHDRANLVGFTASGKERLDVPPKYTLGKPKDGFVEGTFQVDVKIGAHRAKLSGKGRLAACE